jgi:hypothetical protein
MGDKPINPELAKIKIPKLWSKIFAAALTYEL